MKSVPEPKFLVIRLGRIIEEVANLKVPLWSLRNLIDRDVCNSVLIGEVVKTGGHQQNVSGIRIVFQFIFVVQAKGFSPTCLLSRCSVAIAKSEMSSLVLRPPPRTAGLAQSENVVSRDMCASIASPKAS